MYSILHRGGGGDVIVVVKAHTKTNKKGGEKVKSITKRGQAMMKRFELDEI